MSLLNCRKEKALERRYLLPITIGFVVILKIKGLTNIFSSCFIGRAVGEVHQKCGIRFEYLLHFFEEENELKLMEQDYFFWGREETKNKEDTTDIVMTDMYLTIQRKQFLGKRDSIVETPWLFFKIRQQAKRIMLYRELNT